MKPSNMWFFVNFPICLLGISLNVQCESCSIGWIGWFVAGLYAILTGIILKSYGE